MSGITQVGGRFDEPCGIIVPATEYAIAGIAKQPAYLPGDMAMVNGERSSCGASLLTDGTAVVLFFQEAQILLIGDLDASPLPLCFALRWPTYCVSHTCSPKEA